MKLKAGNDPVQSYCIIAKGNIQMKTQMLYCRNISKIKQKNRRNG